MSIVDKAFEFIAARENNKSRDDWRNGKFYPYFDVSRWSIGYGTLSSVYDYDGISDDEAIRRSKVHINADYQALRNVLVNFNDSQKIALLSYAYQHGVNGLLHSEFYSLAKKKALTKEWAMRQPYPSRRLVEVNKFNEIISSSQLGIAFLILVPVALVWFFRK